MNTDLPSPTGILEELADVVINEIDRLAVASFELALDDITSYHKFLFAAYATKDENAKPFSYAEVEATWFGKPYQEWLREYQRIFERAADRIREEPDFISILARLPLRLLPSPITDYSSPIIEGILDLEPMLVSRIENWRTKHVFLAPADDQGVLARLNLSGSDRTVFSDVLREVVGGWETTLQLVGSFYKWQQPGEHSNEDKWRRYSAAWSFLNQHLRNTAYSLALATWNDDEVGSDLFCDALVRWPSVYKFELPDTYYTTRQVLLSPEILSLDWKAAKERLKAIEGDHLITRDESPPAVAASVLERAHIDTCLITSAVIFRWFIEGRQNSDIGAHAARRVFRRELVDPEDQIQDRLTTFRSLFFGILGLLLAGERFHDQSYGAYLDGLARTLDQMSERPVVPNRIYTPSTIRGIDQLLLPWCVMLISMLPSEGDDGAVAALAGLTREVSIFPDGDRSILNITQFLQQMLQAIQPPYEKAVRALNVLSPQTSFFDRREKLESILNGSRNAIEQQRADRVSQLPFDEAKLDTIRTAVEATLLSESAGPTFFQGFSIRRGKSKKLGRISEIKFTGLPRGMFTKPTMGPSWSRLEEETIARISELTKGLVWRHFWRRERQSISLGAEPSGADFWLSLAQTAATLEAPVLLVPNRQIRRMLMNWRHQPENIPAGLRFERKSTEGTSQYIATIEGIDVHFAQIRKPTLLSSKDLRIIIYRPVRRDGGIVDFELLPEEDKWRITLRATLAQSIRWKSFPIIEVESQSQT